MSTSLVSAAPKALADIDYDIRGTLRQRWDAVVGALSVHGIPTEVLSSALGVTYAAAAADPHETDEEINPVDVLNAQDVLRPYWLAGAAVRHLHTLMQVSSVSPETEASFAATLEHDLLGRMREQGCDVALLLDVCDGYVRHEERRRMVVDRLTHVDAETALRWVAYEYLRRTDVPNG